MARMGDNEAGSKHLDVDSQMVTKHKRPSIIRCCRILLEGEKSLSLNAAQCNTNSGRISQSCQNSKILGLQLRVLLVFKTC